MKHTLRACLLALSLLAPAAAGGAEPAHQQPAEAKEGAGHDCGHDCGEHGLEHGRALQREAGKQFHRHVSRSFVIFYEHDAEWARERGSLLDQTHDTFYEAFAAAGFLPTPLLDRLACVIFDDPQDFASYARKVDRVDMSWSRGYYSARTNRMALFDERNSFQLPAAATVAATPASDAEAGARGLGETSLVMRSAPADAPRRQVNDDPALAARIEAVNAAKTAHEAAHQLAFNSGLQKRGVMYPLWVSEGLATNFEPGHPAAEFGPTHDNPSRRRQLLRAKQQRGLMPLADFIALVRLPTGDRQAVVDIYAQTWGLFHFLFNHRPEQLKAYFTATAALPTGPRDRATLRQEFETAFGPVEELETAWLEFVAGLE